MVVEVKDLGICEITEPRKTIATALVRRMALEGRYVVPTSEDEVNVPFRDITHRLDFYWNNSNHLVCDKTEIDWESVMEGSHNGD